MPFIEAGRTITIACPDPRRGIARLQPGVLANAMRGPIANSIHGRR
ncbi:hypothetical protein ACFPRL_17355 [Pseudoclavibacter helvolus]